MAEETAETFLEDDVDVIKLGEAEIEEVELEEEASDLEKARATVGASEHEDPLKALLAVDTSQPIQDTHRIKRLGVDFVIEAFQDDKVYDSVVERATHYVRRKGGNRQRQVDNRRLSKLLVIEGTVYPAFSPRRGQESFAQLAAKYGTEDPETLVGRALLPGEIDQLAEKILELSGYDDDLEEAAGN